MWVRFWYKDANSCSHNEQEFVYAWHHHNESDEILKEYAKEFVPDYLIDSDYGFDYGFEIVSKPPEEELRKLLKKHTQIVKSSVEMIRIIKEAL